LTQIALYDAIGECREVFHGEKEKAAWIDEDFAIKAIKGSNYRINFYYGHIIKNLSRKVSFSHFNLYDLVPFILLFSRWLPKPVRRIVRRLVRRRV